MEPYIIKTDGTKEFVKPKNGKDFKLEELQKIVGGYIETLYLDDMIMVVNEEGKNYGLDFNDAATDMIVTYGYNDFIVGDVLVCDKEMIK